LDPDLQVLMLESRQGAARHETPQDGRDDPDSTGERSRRTPDQLGGLVNDELGRLPDGTRPADRTCAKLIAKTSLPPIWLYDFRHERPLPPWAAASIEVVQEMLGHSSIVLTADPYTSVLPEVAHTAAETVAAHVLKAGRLVPGTIRTRRRTPARKKKRGRNHGARRVRSRAHAGRQIGHHRRRRRC
jgi:hypothetical protein